MKRILHSFLTRFFVTCGKTGRVVGLRKPGGISRLLFPLTGLAALAWILARVLPKPSRAGYPCMKVAAPAATGFLVWLSGLAVSALAFRRAHTAWSRTRYRLAFALAAAGLVAAAWTSIAPSGPAEAAYPGRNSVHEANAPMGTARGVFPGRVVWVHNPDATNENCKNVRDDGWFLPKNNNQAVIDRMLSDGLRALTGRSTEAEAWDAVFQFHNSGRGKGETGYAAGEKILIKTNTTSSWGGNYSTKDLSVTNNQYYGTAETSPQLVLSVLRHLVNTVGAAQTDIYVSDPLKTLYKHCYDLWHAEFPNVHYMDHNYGAEKNREKVAYTRNPVIFYSDRGTVMMTGDWNDPFSGDPTENDRLCTLLETCEYIINVPTMKGHKRAGVTMLAKNHFGSHGREDAKHLHGGLVNPTESDAFREGYGLYRVQVDLMGHRWTGGKQLFCLMDALFAGPEAVYKPTKWKTAPFDNDWTSSLFLSQDPVAIESVGYDFLRAEYTADTEYSWVQYEGADDYLRQAADPANWPADIVYDPENDGTPIGSLGAHEHWDGLATKRYSRNLETGDGIELYTVEGSLPSAVRPDAAAAPSGFRLLANYPNPFNPSTAVPYELAAPARVELAVTDAAGRRVALLVSGPRAAGAHRAEWNGRLADGSTAPSGVYLAVLRVQEGGRAHVSSLRMTLAK